MSLFRADLPDLVVVSATAITSTSNILSGMFDDAVGITIYPPASLTHVFQVQISKDTAASTTSNWSTAVSGGSIVTVTAGQAPAYLSGNIGSLRLSSQGVEATTNGSTTRVFQVSKQFQVN